MCMLVLSISLSAPLNLSVGGAPQCVSVGVRALGPLEVVWKLVMVKGWSVRDRRASQL